MERIEKLLYDASIEGNLTTLQMLIQEDPLILDKVTLNHYDDMPLHIASMLGHMDFVKEILIRKPELSMEYDSQRRLPLHIAAAKGHVEIVKALISANTETCLACDCDGRNALHVAAIRGRYEVVKELMQAQPHAARAMVQHDTILHLCVKYNQLEVLKFLVETMSDHEFLNSRDADGNTILHIAVAYKRIETVNFLVRDTTIEVNALNTNGKTPIEMLSQGPKDVKDQQIIRSLMHVGALDKKKEEGLIGHSKKNIWCDHTDKKRYIDIKSKKDKYLENKRNTLMLVATFVAAMAFQAGVNPPSGVWQDTKQKDKSTGEKGHEAGYAIMFSNNEPLYHTFMIANTMGFVSTLSIVLLLISGLSVLKRPVFVRIMMGIMWMATISMSIAYTVSLWALSPEPRSETVKRIVLVIVAVWGGLMSLIYFGHIDRLEEMINNCLSKRRSPNLRPVVIKQAEIEI